MGQTKPAVAAAIEDNSGSRHESTLLVLLLMICQPKAPSLEAYSHFEASDPSLLVLILRVRARSNGSGGGAKCVLSTSLTCLSSIL